MSDPTMNLELPATLAQTIQAWKAKAERAAALKNTAAVTYATALVASDGKTEGARKAEAEIHSAMAELDAAFAAIEERALYHWMVSQRGVAHDEAA